jgi:predicted DNA-binding transcriptional regulator YafY
LKIDRLLSIVILLLGKELISASELARRFSVSTRTIQRDIDTLSMAGIPVYAQTGQTGGYGILPGYKLNNRLLSRDDFINIITALKSIQGTFSDKRFLGSLEQIYSLVPTPLQAEMSEREKTLLIDFSINTKDTILANKLRIIETAIDQRVLLDCVYTGHKQESVKRIVEPMTLILQWGYWYLFSYCHTRSDFRLFRVSRMHDLNLQSTHFVRREKSYREFLQERPDFQNTNLVNLVFIASASVRAYVEENHPSNELTYQNDGSILVRAVQPEEERMYRYLLSYGDSIKIIEPSHVKDRVRDIAKRILAA